MLQMLNLLFLELDCSLQAFCLEEFLPRTDSRTHSNIPTHSNLDNALMDRSRNIYMGIHHIHRKVFLELDKYKFHSLYKLHNLLGIIPFDSMLLAHKCTGRI